MAAAAKRPDAQPDAQDGMFDQVIENDLLAQALERRLAAKAKASTAAKAAKDATDQAKAMIASLNLDADTTVRCGRFRIKTTTIPERHVEFDTGGTLRLSIGLVKDA